MIGFGIFLKITSSNRQSIIRYLSVTNHNIEAELTWRLRWQGQHRGDPAPTTRAGRGLAPRAGPTARVGPAAPPPPPAAGTGSPRAPAPCGPAPPALAPPTRSPVLQRKVNISKSENHVNISFKSTSTYSENAQCLTLAAGLSSPLIRPNYYYHFVKGVSKTGAKNLAPFWTKSSYYTNHYRYHE